MVSPTEDCLAWVAASIMRDVDVDEGKLDARSAETAEQPAELTAELTEAQMRELAIALGRELSGGEVLCFDGPMGAGKTTFIRAMAEGMGIARPDLVASPTYTVCMVHEGEPELAHVDLYRWGERLMYEGAQLPAGLSGGAFEALGLEEGELGGPGQVMAVEWAEFWQGRPSDVLQLRLEYGLEAAELEHVVSGRATRRLVISGSGGRSKLLLESLQRKWPDAS